MQRISSKNAVTQQWIAKPLPCCKNWTIWPISEMRQIVSDGFDQYNEKSRFCDE